MGGIGVCARMRVFSKTRGAWLFNTRLTQHPASWCCRVTDVTLVFRIKVVRSHAFFISLNIHTAKDRCDLRLAQRRAVAEAHGRIYGDSSAAHRARAHIGGRVELEGAAEALLAKNVIAQCLARFRCVINIRLADGTLQPCQSAKSRRIQCHTCTLIGQTLGLACTYVARHPVSGHLFGLLNLERNLEI